MTRLVGMPIVVMVVMAHTDAFSLLYVKLYITPLDPHNPHIARGISAQDKGCSISPHRSPATLTYPHVGPPELTLL